MNELPYAGITVLDLSQGIAGPAAAGMLARQGADVIKIEPPSGDWARTMGGHFDGQTALSLSANLGKRSVCLDVTKPDGLAAVLRIAKRADVLLESSRPGVADRLGLGADALCARDPRLIYVSVSGYGQTGPQRAEPATDSVIQAASGMMLMNAEPGGQPRKVGMLLVDASNAVYGAQAIGAALFRRERTGRGTRLDLSLLQGAAALQATTMVDHFLHKGRARPALAVPGGTFRTRDGLVNLATVRDAMFVGLSRVIGRPDWIEDPRFATAQGRAGHAQHLHEVIAQRLVQETTAYWLERLKAEDVLVGAVADYDALLAHPQARAQSLFLQVDQPGVGPVAIPRLPGEPAPADGLPPAPRCGEHTREVLEAAGLDPATIDGLVARGIARQAVTPR
jgi:crotonobetainyl-CoA:carnitine CoA-transferase CaiB-like acyl-CoA transferase